MGETDNMGHFVTDLTAASKFSLSTLSQLTSIDGTQGGGGQVETANVSPVNEGPFLLFNTAAQNDADRVYSTCSFVLGSLTCVTGDNTIFYTCAGSASAAVQVGAPGSVPDGCYQLTLNVFGIDGGPFESPAPAVDCVLSSVAPSTTPTATQAAPEPTFFLEFRLQSKKMRRADNTPDTTVQYINVVADESLAYDVLKFVDTQDAATPLSLSAEGYLETITGTISDLGIAGFKGSDDAIRLYPDDTETICDLATCAITAGVFSCEDQGTTGFYVCSGFDRLFLEPVPVGREALCQAVVVDAIAADGGSGTTPSTTASGIFPTGTGSYPSGTGVYPAGSGYFPSGTGSPSGSGYFPTRPAYPTSTGNPSGYPSGTGGFPSGSGYCPSGTGPPSGSGYFPPTNPSGTGFYPPSPTSGRTCAPYHPQTTGLGTGPRYPPTTSGGSNPQMTGGSGGGSNPHSGYDRVPSDILAIFPTGYGGYHWDKHGNIENSAVSIASAPTFLLAISSLLAIFFLV